MAEMADLRPGEHVLDLACGTGLVSFPASTIVGADGSVVGVDISSGMLSQANSRLSKHDLHNVDFYQNSITDLDALEDVKGKQFDAIMCCSALVLLEDAAGALKHWTRYLKPGGRLVTDVTHPMNLAGGTALERVGRRLQRPVPYYREPFQTPEDLRSRMEAVGLRDVEITFLSIQDIPGTEELKDYIVPDFAQPKIQAEYDGADADQVFEEVIGGTAYKDLASPEDVREQAKALFREEWARIADSDGKVRVVDGLFVGKGWK